MCIIVHITLSFNFWGITKDKEKYDSLLEKYKKQQADILLQMEQHSRADENYYIEAGKLLELARRACELFENSKDEEKRQLLKFLLQNSKMQGEKLVPTLQTPFDAILLANQSKLWLPAPRINITPDFNAIILAFQNLSYIGELRQRWVEIKRLNQYASVSVK